MNLIIGLVIAGAVVLFLKYSGKHILQIVLFLLGLKAVEEGEKGAFQLSRKKLSRHVSYAFASGLAAITLPGFYLGRISTLAQANVFLFWAVTLLLLAILLTISAMIVKMALKTELLPILKAGRSLTLGAFFTLLFLAVGFLTGGYFWFYVGKIADNFVKKDVLNAGYHFDLPKNQPKVLNDQNAVYFLKKIPEAKSMSTLMADSKSQEDFKKVFFKGKNETDFMNEFRTKASMGKATMVEITMVRKLLREHADVLGLADTAFAKKTVDWGINYEVEPTWNIEVPKMSQFLNLSRLLACRAIVEANDGKEGSAIKTLQTGLFLGYAARQTTCLIGNMIDVAVCKNILAAARFVLVHVDGRSAESGLIPALESKERTDAFLQSMQWEFFLNGSSLEKMGWLDSAHSIAMDDGFDYLGNNHLFRYWFGLLYRPFILFDLGAYRKINIQCMKAFSLPFSEREKAFNACQEEFNHKSWLLGRFVFFRYYPQMYSKTLEAEAHCRLAKAAVAAKLFHKKNKRWPEAVWELDENRTGEYQDPFTDGANLRIQRYKSGIMIYSVGPDGIDDQGMPFDSSYNKDANYTRFDISWIVY